MKLGRIKLLEPSFNASKLSPVKMVLQGVDHRFDVARDPAELANRLIAGFLLRGTFSSFSSDFLARASVAAI